MCAISWFPWAQRELLVLAALERQFGIECEQAIRFDLLRGAEPLGSDPPERRSFQIDHFVMAITSAEAMLWHTTPRKWLELPHLAGEPAEAAASIQARGAYAAAVGTDCAIQTVPGLINVIQYLDAHRAIV
jgi:hypothetical protein